MWRHEEIFRKKEKKRKNATKFRLKSNISEISCLLIDMS